MKDFYENRKSGFILRGITFEEYAEITGSLPDGFNWNDGFLILWVLGKVTSMEELAELNWYLELGYFPILNHPKLGLFFARGKTICAIKKGNYYRDHVMKEEKRYLDAIASVGNLLENLKKEGESIGLVDMSFLPSITDSLLSKIHSLLPKGYYLDYIKRSL